MKNSLKKILTPGEIIPAEIIKKKDNNNYLIMINEQKVLAFSPINLNTKNILVKIIETYPKIHLKILPIENQKYSQVLDVLKKTDLSFDIQKLWVLKKMINYGYNPENENIVEDINSFAEFSKNLTKNNLIPVDFYAKLFCEDKEVFSGLQEFFGDNKFENIKTNFLNEIRIEDFINDFEDYRLLKKNYKHLNLSLDKIKKIDKLRIILEKINKIDQRTKIYGFLIPYGKRISIVLAECRKENLEISEYQFRLKLDSLDFTTVNLRIKNMEMGIKIRTYLQSTIKMLRKYKSCIKKTLKENNYDLLSYRIDNRPEIKLVDAIKEVNLLK